MTGIEIVISKVGADLAALPASPDDLLQNRVPLHENHPHHAMIGRCSLYLQSKMRSRQISGFLAVWDGLSRHGSHDEWKSSGSRKVTRAA